MPEFRTEIDIEAWEYWDACSRSEKEELVELLVEKGIVEKTNKARRLSDDDEDLRSVSLLDYEWDQLINNLSGLRQRITLEEEATIKSIVSKYV